MATQAGKRVFEPASTRSPRPAMDDDEPLGSYGLGEILPQHKPVFDQFFATFRTPLSDYTFANTFIWRECIHLRWRIVEDFLCVFANGDGGLTLLFPPLGDGDFPAAVREALTVCADYNRAMRIGAAPRIEYVSAETLPRFGAGFAAAPFHPGA